MRDLGLLELAVMRPKIILGRSDLYSDVWKKAAALMHSIIKNPPFKDGNKRTAHAATVVFLELNGYALTSSRDGALAFTRLATAGGMELEEMADWLEAHSQTV